MTRSAFNPKLGLIKTDAKGVEIVRAFGARYHIDGANAPAANTNGVMALTNLGAAVQSITAGLISPAVPRNVVIDGNVSGITGNVKIYGTNFDGAAINETLALNGTTDVPGSLAFKTVTKVDLPVQVHTPAAQTETIAVTAGCGTAGDITVAVTAGTLLGADSPASVTVALTTAMDTVAEVAAAIVAALNDDDKIGAVFTASNEAGVITLAAKTPAANDSTLAMAVTAGSTGVTVGSSTNGTTGVPYDKVSIGWGVKFGLPYMLYAAELVFIKLFNKTADTGTITNDADELEKNVFAVNGTPDGAKDIDLYIAV